MLRKLAVVVAVMAVASAAAWANCGSCAGDKAADKAGAACCKAGDTVYACATCGIVNTTAGKCPKCGADMKATHVLAMKDGKVSLCACGAGCKCTIKDEDPKQCTCGKAVITLDCATACMAAKKPEAACQARPDAETAKPKDHPAH